jgi:hypothetical protein
MEIKNRLLILVCAAAFTAACSGGAKPAPEKLYGTWLNHTFSVTASSGSEFTVQPSDWTGKLGLTRIETTFRPDGGYASDHFGLADSLLFTVEGNWSVTADSIHFMQLTPKESSYTLKFAVEGDTVHFHGMLDWDGEGKPDDRYSGVQIKRK